MQEPKKLRSYEFRHRLQTHSYRAFSTSCAPDSAGEGVGQDAFLHADIILLILRAIQPQAHFQHGMVSGFCL